MKKTERQFAQAISLLFNPGFVWLAILIFALTQSSFAPLKFSVWLAIIIFFNGILPLVLYFFLRRRGYEIDSTGKDARSRSQRAPLIRLMVLVVIFEIILSSRHNPAEPFQAVLFSSVLVGLVATIVNYFWKISLHAMVFSMAIFWLAAITDWQFSWFFLLIPFVCWSRLILERHTWKQVSVAFLAGIFAGAITLWWYGL